MIYIDCVNALCARFMADETPVESYANRDSWRCPECGMLRTVIHDDDTDAKMKAFRTISNKRGGSND